MLGNRAAASSLARLRSAWEDRGRPMTEHLSTPVHGAGLGTEVDHTPPRGRPAATGDPCRTGSRLLTSKQAHSSRHPARVDVPTCADAGRTSSLAVAAPRVRVPASGRGRTTASAPVDPDDFVGNTTGRSSSALSRGAPACAALRRVIPLVARGSPRQGGQKAARARAGRSGGARRAPRRPSAKREPGGRAPPPVRGRGAAPSFTPASPHSQPAVGSASATFNRDRSSSYTSRSLPSAASRAAVSASWS